jgi:hypothetical protein
MVAPNAVQDFYGYGSGQKLLATSQSATLLGAEEARALLHVGVQRTSQVCSCFGKQTLQPLVSTSHAILARKKLEPQQEDS